jgi:hypothetical protein
MLGHHSGMNLTSTTFGRLCGALLFAIAGSACSGVSTPAAAPAPAPATPIVKAAPATGLLAQLRAEIGDAACDTNAQCQTVAVGYKACGGPETYLPWSSKASDGAKIRRLADAHGAERKREVVASGLLSNCMAVMDPGASCSAGRCVKGGANPAI